MFEKKKSEETPTTQAAPDLSALSASAEGAKSKAVEVAKTISTPPMLSPEGQAYTSQLINEAVKGVFAQLGPLLESIALTPEKIAKAEELRRAPDPAKVQREEREKKLQHMEVEENRENQRRVRAACSHRYPSGQSAVNVVRNYPDQQPRGVCVLCHEFFEPKHWEILPPTKNEPRGVPRIAPAHPQYKLVLEALAAKG